MEDDTFDDLGIFRPPDSFYFAEHPDHRWEAEKFGMDLDDVFTTLPKQFNLMAMPILDRESFRLETQHVSYIAHDRAEFYELLQSRLEARRKEQIKMMTLALLRLAGDPEQIELPDRMARHWGHAMHIARSKSFDTIVRFLAGFLRDENPADNVAVLATSQDDHSMLQPGAGLPTQTSENAPSGPAPEMFSRPSSSGSAADKSQKPSAASSPQTRKRSLPTPATVGDDEDEDEARPTKKIRLVGNTSEPRAASSTRRSISPPVKQVRKGQPSSIPQPSWSPTTMVPSPSVGSQLISNEASSGDPIEHCGDKTTPQRIHPGTSGQHVESESVSPDRKDEGGKNNTKDKNGKGPAVTGPETRQSRSRPRSRKRKPPSASPGTKPSSKIQKSTTSRPDRRAIGTTTGQGARSRGAVHQTRSSQRLTRRRGQGGGSFHELDSRGKARSVVA